MKRYTNEQIAKAVKYIIENVETLNSALYIIENAEMLNNALDDALRVKEIEQQNKRYREALTFYAEKSNYDYDVKVDSISYVGDQSDMKFYRLDSEILYDRGKKARKALEGTK